VPFVTADAGSIGRSIFSMFTWVTSLRARGGCTVIESPIVVGVEATS
jgi:hypothetical protein